MSSLPSNKPFSWPARALIGALVGAVFGLMSLFDGLWGVQLAVAVIAGAIFWSTLGVFAVYFTDTRLRCTIFCAFAGGLAGAVSGAILSSNLPAAILMGALGGAALGFLEFEHTAGPGSGAA